MVGKNEYEKIIEVASTFDELCLKLKEAIEEKFDIECDIYDFYDIALKMKREFVYGCLNKYKVHNISFDSHRIDQMTSRYGINDLNKIHDEIRDFYKDKSETDRLKEIVSSHIYSPSLVSKKVADLKDIALKSELESKKIRTVYIFYGSLKFHLNDYLDYNFTGKLKMLEDLFEIYINEKVEFPSLEVLREGFVKISENLTAKLYKNNNLEIKDKRKTDHLSSIFKLFERFNKNGWTIYLSNSLW